MRFEFDEECPVDPGEGTGKFDAPSPWVRPDRLWYKNYPEWMPKTLNYDHIEQYNGVFCVLKLVAMNFPNNLRAN